MSDRPRIGEQLLIRESIDSQQLMQAIRDQAERPGQRLVSMLIKRTLLDPDEGAMALSEQTGFPAALQRHLEQRPEDVRTLIPAALAQRWVVLPIGRAREGHLVVCARDPTPVLAAALAHAIGMQIQLAVTPAILIERLVVASYGPLEDTPKQPSLVDAGMVPVSEHVPRPSRTVSRALGRGKPDSMLTAVPKSLAPLEATLQEIDHAFSVAAAERMVMQYSTQRWKAALLCKVIDGVAMGARGHGERLSQPDLFMLPITSPSLIQLAHDTRHITADAPSSEIQKRLTDLLGGARVPVAGPAIAKGEVHAVLVVGDPVTGTIRDTVTDLEKLLDALGAAYERFGRSSTQA